MNRWGVATSDILIQLILFINRNICGSMMKNSGRNICLFSKIRFIDSNVNCGIFSHDVNKSSTAVWVSLLKLESVTPCRRRGRRRRSKFCVSSSQETFTRRSPSSPGSWPPLPPPPPAGFSSCILNQEQTFLIWQQRMCCFILTQ